MLKWLFLIPLGLCVLWAVYLKQKEYSLGQGKQGFIYILIFSGAIAIFYTTVMWLTHR